jgi:hypothetical protein
MVSVSLDLVVVWMDITVLIALGLPSAVLKAARAWASAIKEIVNASQVQHALS